MNWRRIILKNASANVVRGLATAAVGLVLPPFLTRLLPPERFSAWALLLQVATYANYLDFGLQTAVARFVAHANERSQLERRDEIIAGAFALLAGLGAVTLIATFLMCWQLPHLYRQAPAEMLPDFRAALLVVGCGVAMGLPASVFTGIIIGFHRNEFTAIAIGGSRIGIAVTIILLARKTNHLLAFALVMAAWQMAAYLFQAEVSRRLLGSLSLSWKRITRASLWELASYCASLSAWNVGSLLVVGLDMILVGYLDFKALGAYSIANTLVTFVAGLNGAIFSAMISPAAVLHARNESEQLGALVLRSTRIGIYLTALTGLPLVMYGGLILSHWVRADYVAPALPILQILTIANIIRLAANPYSVAVIGTAQQRLIYISPLVEGVVNLGASIILGARYGAIGVALGTLTGSVVALIWTVFYSVPRTRDIAMTLRQYGLSAVGAAFLMVLPAFVAAQLSHGLSVRLQIALVTAGFLLSGLLILSRENRSEATS